MRLLMSVAFLTVLVLSACSSSGSSSAPAPTPAAQPAAQPTAAAARPAATAGAATSSGAVAPTAAVKPAAAEAARSATGASAAPAPPAPAAVVPGGPAVAAAPQQPAAQQAQPGPNRPIVPPAPAPTPAQPAEPAPVQPAQIGRMVIYTTEVALLVTDPSKAVESIGDVVQQAGGYLAGVENKDDNGTPLTVVRLKVPPDRYDQAMRQLRGLAVEVTSEKATTQDVTEEFNDVQTQLAALDASYKQLLELMNKAQSVDEILKVQEKLSQTKTQIDRLKGRETFLQRSSELATITVSLRPAGDVLARTYSSLKAQLRRSEAQRAQLTLSIQRARTSEEEATLRDQLGEVALQIDRLNARIADVEAKARTASITLPTPPADDATATSSSDQDIVGEYLRLRGQQRAAEVERDRLTSQQRQNPSPEVAEQLRQAILRVSTLDNQVTANQERARRAGVTLPNLTSDQVAALAGLPPESWLARVEVTWWLFVGLAALVVVAAGALIGRRLRRRPSGPAPSPAA